MKRMIRALLRRQLQELGAAFVRSSKTGKRRSRAGTAAYGVLFAVLLAVLMLSFASMALPLSQMLVPQGLGWLYFVLMELTALLVSVLTSAFTSYAHLFRCRDNEQMLALPIPPGTIFLVRCSGVYLTGLVYLLLVWVPTVLCYALAAPDPSGALVSAVPMALLLAGASAVLAVLLGWGVARVTARARHKNWVAVAGTLAFLAVYYAGFLWAEHAMEAMAADALQAGAAAAAKMAAWMLLGKAAMGDGVTLAVLAALVLALMVVCCRMLAGPYLQLLTQNDGTARAEYHARTARRLGLRQTLLRRELQHLGSSPAWLLNGALSTLLLPLLGIGCVWKGEMLRAFAAARTPEELPIFVCTIVCTVAGTNLLTAPSVSLEGCTLWQLQSLPVTPWQVLRAKLELHLLLTLVPGWVCAGCLLAVLGLPVWQGALVLLIAAAYVLLSAQLGLVLGLCLPNLHWTSEMLVIKQSASGLFALFGSWALAGAAALLIAVLAEPVGLGPALAACLAALAGADWLLFRWLQTTGARKFAALC